MDESKGEIDIELDFETLNLSDIELLQFFFLKVELLILSCY